MAEVYYSPHDDGDRAGELHNRTDIYIRKGNDKVRLETHELRREGWGALRLCVRIPALDDEVLALDIPVLPQSLYPCLPVRVALGWAIFGGVS